jgi:hypothetical protein
MTKLFDIPEHPVAAELFDERFRHVISLPPPIWPPAAIFCWQRSLLAGRS